MGARSALLDGLDDLADQWRPGQAGRSGRTMKADRADKCSSMTTSEAARLSAKIGAVCDRKEIAHRSSPRVTVQL